MPISDEEFRRIEALAQAVRLRAEDQTPATPLDVLTAAAKFEQYLREGY